LTLIFSRKAFQAATNVSLDLDDRPMPKIITLPRRRRRRVGPPGATAGAAGTAASTTGTADTPEGNAAAVSAAESMAARASNDRERMLAEDQAAAQ
jgi:hypothetical protein